jgi:hypothetical protein
VSISKRKLIPTLILAAAISIQPCMSASASDFDFYFFGINLKTFKNSNWLMVTAGAITSMVVHELGHILYLDSQGKDWNLLFQSSSGFAVYTDNYLTDRQYRNFGWSGFAFQAGIGTLLTSFESTKHSDFTKGLVSMNAVELWTYDHRNHDGGDDFALIERGNGDKNVNFGTLAVISHKNLAAISSHSAILSALPDGKGKNDQLWKRHPYATSSRNEFNQSTLILPKNIENLRSP